MCLDFTMFIVSLIEFSKHVQNEISAKVMPKPQILPRILRNTEGGTGLYAQSRCLDTATCLLLQARRCGTTTLRAKIN
jgi:hypothetical protein